MPRLLENFAAYADNRNATVPYEVTNPYTKIDVQAGEPDLFDWSDPSEIDRRYAAWREFLTNRRPRYFATLSFKKAYPDHVALETLKHLGCRLNDGIFRTRWQKRGQGHDFVAVAEDHKVSLTQRGSLHFHLLIQDNEAFDLGETPEGRGKRLEQAFINEAIRLKDSSNQWMSGYERINFSTINSNEDVADYLTKQLRTPSWELGDNVFLSDYRGIVGTLNTRPWKASEARR